MLIMLLAVLGIGTIQNGNVANAATVGQQLTQPEDGWKRYDDTDSKIQYSQEFINTTDGGCYNETLHYTTNKSNGTISFKFYGTKLRIINPLYLGYSDKIQITIDGISDYYTETTSKSALQMLLYEKTSLPLAIHTVNITKIDNGSFSADFHLDAIDIDKDGYLLSSNESISLDKSSMDLVVGDSQSLATTTTPSGATVNWSSSDESIATVDSTGKVTALKEGQTVITATTADGLTATCVVTVIPKTAEPTNPDPSDSDKIVNIAHAKGDNTNNAGGDVTIIFHGAADTILSVVKTADVKEVWVGDNFTYTIVVTNTGTKTAKAVVVNDPAPNHIDFVVNGITTTQGTVDPSSTSKNIIVNVGDIAPGATVTIKIPATVVL